MNVVLDKFSQMPLWPNAGSPLLGLAILEHDQGRDAPHLKAPASIWIFVDVKLGYLDLALVVSG